jgi:hypothetical protein
MAHMSMSEKDICAGHTVGSLENGITDATRKTQAAPGEEKRPSGHCDSGLMVKGRMIKNYSDLLRFGQIYSDDWVLINGVRAKSLRFSAI